ncbi:hypothetical protein RYX36_020193 [Vicia faba]
MYFSSRDIKKELIMHRSASWNRFSDDYFKHVTSSSSSSLSPALKSSSNNLPTYDPILELAKRRKHVLNSLRMQCMPSLLFCFFVLSFFGSVQLQIWEFLVIL